MKTNQTQLRDGSRSEPLAWMLLIYKVPTDPARKRTYVWRRLKKLGALYLQQAVALLPSRPGLAAQMQDLARRIVEFEGEVTLLTAHSASPEWEQEMIERFNRQRDEEYAELAEVAGRLVDELERESSRGKFSFAELEENEGGLEHAQRWLAQVQARDFFGAPGRTMAEAALERASSALKDFATRVYEQEDK
ncbi:MAG: hypothetical protein M1546_04190 [Chloroflexi bacterium]|nr:hypothetical protein [Chloroflexota bacterium]